MMTMLFGYCRFLGTTIDVRELATMEHVAQQNQIHTPAMIVLNLYDALKHPENFPAWFGEKEESVV